PTVSRFGRRRAQAQGRHLGRPGQYQVDPRTAQALLAGGASLRATLGSSASIRVQSSARSLAPAADHLRRRLACLPVPSPEGTRGPPGPQQVPRQHSALRLSAGVTADEYARALTLQAARRQPPPDCGLREAITRRTG